MKRSLALVAMLAVAASASAQQPSGQAKQTKYGARLTSPENEDDPTDRAVGRRLNTRVSNRLETRIERYEFIDTKSADTSGTAPNPYRVRPTEKSTEPTPPRRRRDPPDARGSQYAPDFKVAPDSQ